MSKPKRKVLNCLSCGEPFTQSHGNQRTCSKECSKERERLSGRKHYKKQDKPSFSVECPKCHHLFRASPKRRLKKTLKCRICRENFVRGHPTQVLCGKKECKRANARLLTKNWLTKRNKNARS